MTDLLVIDFFGDHAHAPNPFRSSAATRGWNDTHAAAHVIAFDRGGAIAVATRLPVGLARRGGWGDAAVMLPAGVWRDEFTGREAPGGPAPLAAVLAEYPVALLVRAP